MDNSTLVPDVQILHLARFVPSLEPLPAVIVACYGGLIIVAGAYVQKAVLRLISRLKDRLINRVIVVNQVGFFVRR